MANDSKFFLINFLIFLTNIQLQIYVSNTVEIIPP